MTLLLNRELVSRVKLGQVSVFPDIVKDWPMMRNLPKILIRCFKNEAPDLHLWLSNLTTVLCLARCKVDAVSVAYSIHCVGCRA